MIYISKSPVGRVGFSKAFARSNRSIKLRSSWPHSFLLIWCRTSIWKPHRIRASDFFICSSNTFFQACRLTCFILISSTRSLLAGNNGLGGRVSPFPGVEVAVPIRDRGPWRGMMSRFPFKARLHAGHGLAFGPSHEWMHDQQKMWPHALVTGSHGASMQMVQVNPFGRASCFSSVEADADQLLFMAIRNWNLQPQHLALRIAYQKLITHSLTQNALEPQWRTRSDEAVCGNG